MKIFIAVILLVLPVWSYGQDEIRPVYGHELSLGINSPFIDFNLDSSEKVHRVSINQQFWNLSYKIKFSPRQTLRAGINFNILPDSTEKYWVRGLNAGYQYQFNSPSMRWQWFVGGDIAFFYDVSYIGLESDSLKIVPIVERAVEIGLGPMAGVQFRISPRVSLTSEFGFYCAFRNKRISTDEIPPDERSSKNDFNLDFHRLFSLGIGYNFGTFHPAPAINNPSDTEPVDN